MSTVRGGRYGVLWIVAVATGLAVSPASGARAQKILLQIRPHMNDTLFMRLDQQTELVGTRKVGAEETSTSMTTMLRLFSHAVVAGSTSSGTLIETITDSVDVSSTQGRTANPTAAWQRLPAPRDVRIRIAPDGTVEMVDTSDDAHRDASELMSLMPAAFPREPVAVGDSWTRDMPVPSGTVLGAPPAGVLHATFRLDSLDRGAHRAFISMRGSMTPAAVEEPNPQVPVLEKGRVTGGIVLDRTRGWLIESQFVISVTSRLTPPLSSGMAPMTFVIKVTQRVRTMDKR